MYCISYSLENDKKVDFISCPVYSIVCIVYTKTWRYCINGTFHFSYAFYFFYCLVVKSKQAFVLWLLTY